MVEFIPISEKKDNPAAIDAISKAAGIGYYAAKVLYFRGIDTPEKASEFMQGDPLHDPMLLHDMEKAVDTLSEHISNGNHITIYGDYDADGICASTILYLYLQSIGANVFWFIPNRQDDGYGLSKQAIANLAEEGSDLIVTVDCGITAIEEVEFAISKGLDVIVTDHHKPLEDIPQCSAVVVPLLSEQYPFLDLCGAGVALKLVQALSEGDAVMDYVDIAAMATVADIVPLVGENRTIVKLGLEAINNMPRVGIEKLIDVAGITQGEVTSTDISFQLAPRINSAGRMGDCSPSVELLITEDAEKATMLAKTIDDMNTERKKMEEGMLEHAKKLILEMPLGNMHCITVASAEFHAGVAGIIASRLVEQYRRPVIVASQDENGIYTASMRGISGVNVFDALHSCKDLLIKYGGHEMAAGFSIHAEHLEEFTQRMEHFFKTTYDTDTYIKKQHYDLKVSIEDFSVEMVEDLQTLMPFGHGNPSPVLYLQDAKIEQHRVLGKTGDHICLGVITPQNNEMLEVLAFWAKNKGWPRQYSTYDILGNAEISTWKGRSRVQMISKSFRSSPELCDIWPRKNSDSYAYYFSKSLGQSRGYLGENLQQADYSFVYDKIMEDSFGTLIISNVPESAISFIDSQKDKNVFRYIDIYWVNVFNRYIIQNIFLMAPHSSLDFDRYRNIIFLDAPIGNQLEQFKGKNIYSCNDIDALESFRKSLLLTTEQMRDVYRAILSVCRKRFDSNVRLFQKIQEKLPEISKKQIASALTIFNELGFIDINSRINVVLKENTINGKIPLETSEIYQALHHTTL